MSGFGLDPDQLRRLDGILKRVGLAECAGYFRTYTLPTVRLRTAADGRAGRLGGEPRLPPGTAWPRTADGTPLTFVVELDLREVARAGAGAALPDSGALFLFVGSDDSAIDMEHRVLFAPDGPGANPVPAPAGGDGFVTGQDRSRWRPASLEAEPSIQLPVWSYFDRDLNELGLLDPEEGDAGEAVEDAEAALAPHAEAVRMLGWQYSDHSDGYLEAKLAIERTLTGRVATVDVYDPDLQQQAEREYTLLFEVDSIPDLGIRWWDAGFLQVFIRDADLQAGVFDRTYCTLYSS